MLGCKIDPSKLVKKLRKRIGNYFGTRLSISDFDVDEMHYSTDICEHSSADALEYIRVMKRVGRVKGYSVERCDGINAENGVCLAGNSNGRIFVMYILPGSDGKDIRIEVRLMKPKAIREWTTDTGIEDQISELSRKRHDIFMDTVIRIVPYGIIYKKKEADEIVRRSVGDKIMRRRMLLLIELIPKKKSLLLAQKALGCRDVPEVMRAFAEINLSPVTLSKRSDTKYLQSIYEKILAK